MEWTPNDIIIVGAGLGGALGALIAVIQRSRCNEINCCCIKCKRQVPPVQTQNNDVENPQSIT